MTAPTTVLGFRASERALLLALLDEKRLTRDRRGWATKRRIFAAVTGSKVVALGFAIVQAPAHIDDAELLILTTAGEQRARNERAFDLGRYADNIERRRQS